MTDPLVLLDATLLFFRALHGLPDVFRDDDGRSINGVRGYLTFLQNVLAGGETLGPERHPVAPVRYCAAAFDESLTTCWRNAFYPDYKANRPPADENVLHQLALCRKLTEVLGIPVLADLQYEADDYIATLARRSRRPVVIISRDKDLQQLLGETVTLLDPKGGTPVTREAFVDTFGFEPSAFPDYQSLTGDSVDNIPGVPGIGPKSARRLIETFGSLEAVYAESADWSRAGIRDGTRTAERLFTHREQAFLYRQILRLDAHTPLSIDMADTRLRRPSRAAVAERLDALGVRAGLGGRLVGALEDYGV